MKERKKEERKEKKEKRREGERRREREKEGCLPSKSIWKKNDSEDDPVSFL